MRVIKRLGLLLAAVSLGLLGSGCSSIPPAPLLSADNDLPQDYLIGPGDELQIFVWRNPEFSVTLPVRPDGRISAPLVEDLVAVGKTSTQLARELEKSLSNYVRNPVVTVIVRNFVGSLQQQIRVIGAAAQPRALPYRNGMTLLDVMIEVGGQTQLAAGNRSSIVRSVAGKQKSFSVRVDDLLNDGDMSANVRMLPGDILIIPESFF